jgi:hypothetical protein
VIGIFELFMPKVLPTVLNSNVPPSLVVHDDAELFYSENNQSINHTAV